MTPQEQGLMDAVAAMMDGFNRWEAAAEHAAASGQDPAYVVKLHALKRAHWAGVEALGAELRRVRDLDAMMIAERARVTARKGGA